MKTSTLVLSPKVSARGSSANRRVLQLAASGADNVATLGFTDLCANDAANACSRDMWVSDLSPFSPLSPSSSSSSTATISLAVFFASPALVKDAYILPHVSASVPCNYCMRCLEHELSPSPRRSIRRSLALAHAQSLLYRQVVRLARAGRGSMRKCVISCQLRLLALGRLGRRGGGSELEEGKDIMSSGSRSLFALLRWGRVRVGKRADRLG